MPEHSYLSPVEPDDAFTVRRVDFVALAELGPRSDYVWARVDPCLKYPDNAEGESFEYVALRPRREGDSILEPIEWPVAVSVVVPTRGELQLAARIDGDDGRLLYRGLSHRTLAEALCNDPLPRAEQYEPRFRCARPGEEGRSDLIVIDCSELTKAHFAYLPCWSWVDGNYFMADDGFPFDEDAVTPTLNLIPYRETLILTSSRQSFALRRVFILTDTLSVATTSMPLTCSSTDPSLALMFS